VVVILAGLVLAVLSARALRTVDTAKSSLTELLEGDPASAVRWCDLGEELLAAGQAEKASYSMARATVLAPNIPAVWVRAGNLHFQLGEPDKAVRYTTHALALVPDYDTAIFGYYDALVPDRETVLDALGANPRALNSYLRHLISTNQLAGAESTWARSVRAGVTDDLAAEYLELLVRNGKRREAAETWSGYAGKRSPDYRTSNQLFNPDFENEFTKAVFDWKILPLEGVEAGRDGSQAWSGHWSLRIRFHGQANVDYQYVTQAVYLTPGTYRLLAHIKTDSLTTDQGVRLRIFDRDAPQRLDVGTEQVTGTLDWTSLQKVFTVAAPTNLVTIQVRRNPSLKIENKIDGTVWIDKLSLTRI
jgi:tetratricopeptide repeat protein